MSKLDDRAHTLPGTIVLQVEGFCHVILARLYEGLWSRGNGMKASAWYFQSEKEANAFARRLSSPDDTAEPEGCPAQQAEWEEGAQAVADCMEAPSEHDALRERMKLWGLDHGGGY